MKKLTKKVNLILKANSKALGFAVFFSSLPVPSITPKQLFALIIKSPV